MTRNNDTDVEQLLHDTLSARAATMTEAPAFAGPPSQPHRRWPALVAAAAVVALAGGLLAVRGGDDPDPAANGRPVTACRTTLPAQWVAAKRAAPDSVDGHATVPLVIAPDGSVVVYWMARAGVMTVGVTGRDGTTRALHTFPARQAVVSADTDGRSVVLSLGPGDDPQAYGVDDIVVVDLRTKALVHVLKRAHRAAGTSVMGRSGAVIQDGVVYWAAGSRHASGSGGPILGYDVADGTTRVVARVDGVVDDVIRTSAGVVWPGGSVPGPALPPGVPRLPYESNDPVRTDGTAFAWTPAGDPRVVDWADRDGRTRSVDVDLAGLQPVGLDGVSGDFVVLGANSGDHSPLLVLDTRTGAIADLGTAVDAGSAGAGTIVLLSGRGTVRLDTSRLPGLTC